MAQGDISQTFLDQWIKFIEKDDSLSIDNIIQCSDDNLKDILLYKDLPEWQIGDCGHNNKCNCYPYYLKHAASSTLQIAMSVCAKDTTRLLLEKGSNVMKKDRTGNNIIHHIIYLTFFRKGKVEEYVDFYLANIHFVYK